MMQNLLKTGIRTPCNYVGLYLPGRRGYVDAQSEDEFLFCVGVLFSLVRLFCLKEQLDCQVSPIWRMVLEHQGALCGIRGDSVTHRFIFQVFA